MGKGLLLMAVALVPALAISWSAWAQEPVKWSAPLSAYPKQWTPSAAPATPNNQYASQYPHWGAYSGSAPYSGLPPSSWKPGYAPQEYVGNPYWQPYAR